MGPIDQAQLVGFPEARCLRENAEIRFWTDTRVALGRARRRARGGRESPARGTTPAYAGLSDWATGPIKQTYHLLTTYQCEVVSGKFAALTPRSRGVEGLSEQLLYWRHVEYEPLGRGAPDHPTRNVAFIGLWSESGESITAQSTISTAGETIMLSITRCCDHGSRGPRKVSWTPRGGAFTI